jgi:hypothetical protein
MADDMQNIERVVTAGMTRDIIAGLTRQSILSEKVLWRSLMDARVKPAYDG